MREDPETAIKREGAKILASDISLTLAYKQMEAMGKRHINLRKIKPVKIDWAEEVRHRRAFVYPEDDSGAITVYPEDKKIYV